MISTPPPSTPAVRPAGWPACTSESSIPSRRVPGAGIPHFPEEDSGFRTCRHCRAPIVPCPWPTGFCKGWKHADYLHYGPVGPHYCQGRSINPMAEPETP